MKSTRIGPAQYYSGHSSKQNYGRLPAHQLMPRSVPEKLGKLRPHIVGPVSEADHSVYEHRVSQNIIKSGLWLSPFTACDPHHWLLAIYCKNKVALEVSSGT